MSLLLTIFKRIISLNNFLSLKLPLKLSLLIVTELYCRNFSKIVYCK